MAYQNREELATILELSEEKYKEAMESGYEGTKYQWMAENALNNGYVRLHFPLGTKVHAIIDSSESESGFAIVEVEFSVEHEPYVGNAVFATVEECLERLQSVLSNPPDEEPIEEVTPADTDNNEEVADTNES